MVLEILGAMAVEAEQNAAAANAEAARQAAARKAYCADNWRQASANMEQGNLSLISEKLDAAIRHYQQAIALLDRCGDRANSDRVRRNLEIANRKSAAIRDDNRVDEARRRYGDTIRQPSNNPFAAQGSTASNDPADSDVRIAPQEIYTAALKSCSYASPRSDAWKRCMVAQEGRIIMESEPLIKAACSWQQEQAARSECALKAYAEKVAAKAAGSNELCYFRETGQPCHPGGGRQGARAEPKESLRERLKRALAADRQRRGMDPAVSEEELSKAVEAETNTEARAVATAPTTAAATPQDDDPLQAYLRSESATRGYSNAGQFTGGQPSLTGIEPSPEQRREMDTLLKREHYGPPTPHPRNQR